MRFLFSIVLLFSTFSIYAQDYEVTHYTVEDGLMSNEVKGIFQDSLGVVWVANGLGFTKFYGDRVENITGCNENELSDFKKLNNIYFSEKYLLKENKIETLKQWDETPRGYRISLSIVYQKKYVTSYYNNQGWKFILTGD
jgi:ligand-binding sensor domain-containing protein